MALLISKEQVAVWGQQWWEWKIFTEKSILSCPQVHDLVKEVHVSPHLYFRPWPYSQVSSYKLLVVVVLTTASVVSTGLVCVVDSSSVSFSGELQLKTLKS